MLCMGIMLFVLCMQQQNFSYAPSLRVFAGIECVHVNVLRQMEFFSFSSNIIFSKRITSSINKVLCHESFITPFFCKCQNGKRVTEIIVLRQFETDFPFT